MSMPRKTLKKEAAIRSTASKASADTGAAKIDPKTPGKLVDSAGSRSVKIIGKATGSKGRGRVYDPPKPAKPRTVKR